MVVTLAVPHKQLSKTPHSSNRVGLCRLNLSRRHEHMRPIKNVCPKVPPTGRGGGVG
jgi:hypothetical protein